LKFGDEQRGGWGRRGTSKQLTAITAITAITVWGGTTVWRSVLVAATIIAIAIAVAVPIALRACGGDGGGWGVYYRREKW
jgi:hypothetical protein